MQSQHLRTTTFTAISATKNLDKINMERQWAYSAQFVVSNVVTSISAVAKLQCSNDGVNWDDIASATKTLNAAGAQMLNITDIAYLFIRVVITYTSGTADIKVLENSKGA